MPDHEDEFFKHLAGGVERAFDPIGGHTDDSEWVLIKKVMKAAGAVDYEGHVLEVFRADCPGFRWPNLSWLRGRVELPVVFGRRQVPFQADALIDMAKRFTKTPSYQAWLSVADEAEQQDGAVGRVAVAFRWPQWGDMVIHDLPDDLPTQGTFLVHYTAGARFVIEPLAGFLERLRLPSADQWRI